MGFPIQTHENKVVEVTEQDRGTNIDSPQIVCMV